MPSRPKIGKKTMNYELYIKIIKLLITGIEL